jgi:hypothetical protein
MKLYFGLFICFLVSIMTQAASLVDTSRTINKRQLKVMNVEPHVQQLFAANNIPSWAAIQYTTWGARIFF